MINSSLRSRLIVALVLLTTLGLLVANISGVLLLRTYLYDRIDAQSPFGSRLPAGRPDVNSDLCTRRDGGPIARLPSDFKLVVLDASGHQRCTLETSVGPRPDVPRITLAQAKDQVGQLRTVGSVGGSGPRWRIRAQPLVDGTGTVITAVSLAQTDATVQRLVVVSAATSLVVLLLVAVGGWFLVGVGLRPLTTIEDTAEAIAHGDLSRRVPIGRPGTEVGRLSRSLNEMLTQIEAAFSGRAESEDRLRRFIADASHELRTPLATIRGHAELYRQGAVQEPADVARLLGRIESQTFRMGGLVEDMLLLARLDQDRVPESRIVDMLSLASDAVSDAQAMDPNRRITLVRMNEPPFVEGEPVTRGDESRLRQVLGNLVVNALRHTPAGTPVDVRVGVRYDGEPRVVIEVSDQGPGMPEEVAARVFERFYRADPSRSRQQGGTGLGLSIVAAVVEAHGGQIECHSTPGSGTTFVVTLPAVLTGPAR
ncbi:MAG: two-component system, OmpR family, sensor kinase [Actinomycetota bacterium]|nr:two-component system, OmpR family, sensor kinase [Actinomycetota bacterium]